MVVEKWVGDVRLYDCCLSLTVGMELLFQESTSHIARSHQINTVASVCALSWLDYPNMLVFITSFLLDLQKFVIGLVVGSLEVVCFGEDGEWIYLLHISIIVLHRIKQSFFRPNERVLGNMVCDCLYFV
jgi:hypothetical protein